MTTRTEQSIGFIQWQIQALLAFPHCKQYRDMGMRVILLLISITALMGLLQLPSLHEWAQWDHNAIIEGQWWRIVTGNLTHTNLYHLGMNVGGLWIISFIFREQIYIRQFIVVFAGLCIAVGSMLLLTSMQLYVGLSGVLHGLFGFYAMQEYRLGRKSSLYLLIGLAAKIIWEQCFGSPTGTEALIHAKVAIDAHLFGSVFGVTLSIATDTLQTIKTKKEL